MLIEDNKDLSELTTFGIPARAAHYAEYASQDELERIVRSPLYFNNRTFHIGGGSNLLFARDFDGLVLRSAIKGITKYPRRDSEDDVYLIVGAGEKWDDVVDYAVAHGLAGLENMAGIPGTAGASVVQNVGAYGVEAGQRIYSVVCFDTQTRTERRFTAEECRFGYRDSYFKKEGRGRYYVLRVCYLLRRSEAAEEYSYGPLRAFADALGRTPTIGEVAAEVRRIRDSKLPNPEHLGSAGSFFKNPVINAYYYAEEIADRTQGMPVFQVNEHSVKLSAAWLIDHAGLKGARVGGAQVYEKQPLVIVNTGDATAQDVIHLAEKVQHTVHEKFGVLLEPEVNIIDNTMRITVLGSGTSKGVPEIACSCHVCKSPDPRDKRLRASVLVQTEGLNLMLDASPDLRQQALTHNLTRLDAVLMTHSHYDHVGGIDDLRVFCANGALPLYVREDVDKDLRKRLDYCFREHLYPGVPVFDMHIVDGKPFYINGVRVEPIEVMHGRLPIFGYRIGKFAYITDAKTVSESARDQLRDLDVLIVNALRKKEHFAHFSLEEALELIADVKPKRAYLTHFNHQMPRYEELSKELPDNVYPAYDGLEITVD